MSRRLNQAQTSVAQTSGAQTSVAQTSGAQTSVAQTSVAQTSGAHTSVAQTSGAQTSVAQTSGAQTSVAQTSVAQTSGAHTSVAQTSVAQTSGAHTSVAQASDGVKGLNKFAVCQLLFLLDQPGKIRAYKLVKADGLAPFNGGITYEVGKLYEVADADTNEETECAKGINLATLDWCIKEMRDGYRILIAEFEAKDIAAIPTASDGKFRVFRCSIVGEKNIKEIGL